MSHVWEINGLSLELDLDNYDNMKRYEEAFDLMQEEETQLPKDGRQSERMLAYCQLYYRLYDRIFGEGTSEKIFSGVPVSIRGTEEVYESFLAFVKGQMVQQIQEQQQRYQKYMPNRKQRRTVSKTVRQAAKK